MKVNTTLNISLDVHQDIIDEINKNPEIITKIAKQVTDEMVEIIKNELEDMDAANFNIEGYTVFTE